MAGIRRTLLIAANTETINMPTLPMGLGCVAEALRAAGHAVTFLGLRAVDDWRPLFRQTAAEAAMTALLERLATGKALSDVPGRYLRGRGLFERHQPWLLTDTAILHGPRGKFLMLA